MTFIIPTFTTASQGLGNAESIYVTPTGIMVTSGSAIIRNSDGLANFSVAVDGTVVSTAAIAIRIDSDNGAGIGSHDVTIGQSGIVRSMTDSGIWIDGDDSTVLNHGEIHAIFRGIYNLSGGSFDVFNTGLIAAGEGIVSAGDDAFARNSGIVAAVITGMFLSGANVRLENSGEVSGQKALYVTGINGDIVNSGVLSATNEGIDIAGLGVRVINSGLITSGGTGIVLDSNSVLAGATSRVINTGDILATSFGIDIGLVSAVVHNLGRIVSHDDKAIDSLGPLALVNRGVIAGGTEMSGNSIAINLSANADVIRNFGTITGSVLTGGGNDVVRNGAAIEREINLGTGADLYLGSRDTTDALVIGGDGGDVILSGGGDDNLQGGTGNDDIRGGLGDDLILGGTGGDTMRGGGGADTFVFGSAADMPLSRQLDTITDFTPGQDLIDLGAFMRGGAYAGEAEFSGAVEVIYEAKTGTLSGDVNGDKLADWTLILSNRPSLTEADFAF